VKTTMGREESERRTPLCSTASYAQREPKRKEQRTGIEVRLRSRDEKGYVRDGRPAHTAVEALPAYTRVRMLRTDVRSSFSLA